MNNTVQVRARVGDTFDRCYFSSHSECEGFTIRNGTMVTVINVCACRCHKTISFEGET